MSLTHPFEEVFLKARRLYRKLADPYPVAHEQAVYPVALVELIVHADAVVPYLDSLWLYYTR